MRSIRRSGVTALTAAIALSLGAIPVSLTAGVLTASDEDPSRSTTGGLVATTYGYLAIQSGVGPDRITWYRPGGNTPVDQTIKTDAAGCKLVTTPLDDATTGALPVMAFNGQYTGRNGQLNQQAESWVPGSIGVAEKTSGVSCAQVGAPSESLDLKVGPAVQPSAGDTGLVVASAAYLDVELKQDARILGSAMLNGVTVGYFELQSGSTIGITDKPSGVTSGIPYAIQACRNPSDSGPDSGANDNCRWAVSNPTGIGTDDGINFDTISLRAVTGSFSIEYGRDGTPVDGPSLTLPANMEKGASFLELTRIDGVLGCEPSNNTSILVGTIGQPEPQVQVRRLPNAPKTGTTTTIPCTPIPYTLENGSSSATFLKPTNQQTTAQFVFEMVWTTPTQSAPSPGSPLPATYADYETGGRPVELPWCPNPTYSSGLLTGLATTAGLPDQDQLNSPDYPRVAAGTPLVDTQFSCIGTRSIQVMNGTTSGTLRITEQIYVLGDIKLLR